MYLDTNKPIASVKYNGVDMDLVGGSGEITITENGTHDVTQYASANVNVQSAPVLLWTNASPSSSFAAQTVAFDEEWDGYIIEGRFTIDELGYLPKSYVPADGSFPICAANNKPIACSRLATATRMSIQFGLGYYPSNPTTAGQSNAYCIPTRIWGVKFTL